MHPKIFQAILFLCAAGVLSIVQWLTPPVASRPSPAASTRTIAPGPNEIFDDLAGDDGVYSSPKQAQPTVKAPSAQAWAAASQKVFLDVRNDKIDAFLTLTSTAGVWITGLAGHPETVHVTPVELSQDLHHRGSLYRAIFLDHRSGNFVVSPDGQARVLTLLLK